MEAYQDFKDTTKMAFLLKKILFKFFLFLFICFCLGFFFFLIRFFFHVGNLSHLPDHLFISLSYEAFGCTYHVLFL